MAKAFPNDDGAFYRCGKCKGNIYYVKSEKKPQRCPECGYEHGTRDVNDIPRVVKLLLNEKPE
jgi:uncharacterized protein (DUF983 family)